MDNVYRRDHEMPYIADGAVTSQQKETKKAIREYNEAMPFDLEKGMECLERAGIKHKENVYFEPPFYCEYGNHIEVGENFYANTHCVMLDVGKITIGNNVLFGPNVGITQLDILSIRRVGTQHLSMEFLSPSGIMCGSAEAAVSFLE